MKEFAPHCRDEFPSYFSLFDYKVTFLSKIYAESPNLGRAVRKMIDLKLVRETRVQKPDGTMDSMVSLPKHERKPNKPRI